MQLFDSQELSRRYEPSNQHGKSMVQIANAANSSLSSESQMSLKKKKKGRGYMTYA